MFAPALVSAKDSAGVVVALATEVVNNGERLPLLNVETVPPPERPSQLLKAPSVDTKAVSPCSNLIFAPPQIVGCAAAPNESRAKKRIMMFFMFKLKVIDKPNPCAARKAACAVDCQFAINYFCS